MISDTCEPSLVLAMDLVGSQSCQPRAHLPLCIVSRVCAAVTVNQVHRLHAKEPALAQGYLMSVREKIMSSQGREIGNVLYVCVCGYKSVRSSFASVLRRPF